MMASPLELLKSSGSLQEYCLRPLRMDDLPLPLRENPRYYDGNIFFARVVGDFVRSADIVEVEISDETLCLLASTNGVNDWWMDESGWSSRGRDYKRVLNVWDAINVWGYSQLSPDEFCIEESADTEIVKVIAYYQSVLDQIPPASRRVVIQHLLAINLYQGLSLLQESGIRRYVGLEDLSNNDGRLLQRMQVEKGGMMAMYIAPIVPSLFVLSDVLPLSPPSLIDNYERFINGGTVYPEAGIIRYAIELGGIVQVVDDLEDANFDLMRRVISPENLHRREIPREDLSLAIRNRIPRLLNELSKSKDESKCHAALFAATEMLTLQIAEHRAQRVLVRERDFEFSDSSQFC